MRLDGRTVVVTGGANGIGAACAQAYVAEAARVVVADVDATAGARVAALIGEGGGEAIFVETDVADSRACAALVAAAVDRFGRLDALEGAPHGVRANALIPGTTDTPMIRREVNAATDPDAMLRRWSESIPLGRMAQPEDVAKAAVFLASDDASFVTGQCLAADGGQMATFNTGSVYGYTD